MNKIHSFFYDNPIIYYSVTLMGKKKVSSKFKAFYLSNKHVTINTNRNINRIMAYIMLHKCKKNVWAQVNLKNKDLYVK